MAPEDSNANKSKVRDLRKKEKYHDAELGKLKKEESRLLSNDGYEEKSHKLIWFLVIIVIVVALAWFFFVKRGVAVPKIPLVHP
jgi:hypothetical protein